MNKEEDKGSTNGETNPPPTTPPHKSGSSSDFTILSQPSSNDMSPTDMSNLMLSIHSITQDMNLEEALARLRDLLKENHHLKETIQQNNTIMKQQYNLMCDLKSQKEKLDVEMKKRYEQARQVVADLREKNELYSIKMKTLEEELQSRAETMSPEQSEEYARKIQLLEQANRELQIEQRLAEEREKQLTQELQDIKGKEMEVVGEMAEPLQSPEGEVESLKLRYEQAMQEREEWQMRAEEIGREMDKYKDEIDELCAEKSELGLLKSKLEKENSDFVAHLQELSVEVEKLTNEKSRLQNVNDRLLVEKKDLLALNNQLNTEWSMNKSEQNVGGRLGSLGFVVVDKKQGAGSGSDEQGVESMEEEAASDSRKVKHEKGMSDLLLQLQEERNQVAEFTTKNADLRNRLEETCRELEEKSRLLVDSHKRLSSAEGELGEKSAVVNELLQRLDNMASELQHSKGQIGHSMPEDLQNLRCQALSLVKELKESDADKEAYKKAYETEIAKTEHLQTQLCRCQQDQEAQRSKDDNLLVSMRGAITNLEGSLAVEKHNNQQLKNDVKEVGLKYNKCCQDYQELFNTFDEYKKSQDERARAAAAASGRVGVAQQQQRELTEKVDHMTAKILVAEEALAQKDERIEQLEREVVNLRVQAEVYKSDFDEERAARVKMAELKESLMEEIQQLQMSNQHLLDEQESLARNQLAEMQRRHAHPAYHPGFQTFPRQHPAPAGAYAPVPEAQGARYNQPAIRVAADRDVFVENAEERLVGEEPQIYPGLTPRGIHGNQPAVEALPGRSPSRGSQGSSAQEDDESLYCPKCQKAHYDIDTLQRHVIECLDIKD